MYYDFVMIVSMGFFLMRLSIIWFHTNTSTRLLMGSTANAFVLTTQLHEHFHLFTFQMYNAFENCIYGYWISQRDFFSGRPPPPNLLFPLLCIKSNKQNWDIPLFKACLLYYILRFFPRESLAVLGGGKMNLFCAIILHLVIIRR